jgi:hypothetical protein
MAVDGSRWQFLRRAPNRLAPRDAIENEFFARALQHISLALPRFVKLSNCGAREFAVSLGPDGGRKIFSNSARVVNGTVSDIDSCHYDTSGAGEVAGECSSR